MLGGEEEDDMQALAEEINNQVDRPRMVPGEGRQQSSPMRDRPSTSGTQQQDYASSMQHLLSQNNRLLELLTRQHEQREPGEKEKKRKKEEKSYDPEDAVLLQLDYHINDDGHEKIEWKLRQMIRPINAPPDSYWKKGMFKQVERPILGASLYMDHIIPQNINEGTLCKSHDRCAYVEIKNFLSRNSGVGREVKRKLEGEIKDDQFSMGIKTQWDGAENVWEVIDAGWNFLGAEFMIRNYSFAAIAIMRALHDCRYFCGVAVTAKQQKSLLEQFFNDCFKVNPFSYLYVRL